MKSSATNLTNQDIQQMKLLLQKALSALEHLPISKSCRECKHYDQMGSCGLVGKYVPKEVIDVGCEMYLFDELSPPF